MEKIISAEPMDNFTVKIRTSNGITGIFDVKPYLNGSAFKQLTDKAYFKTVRPRKHGHGIVWPNDQDFSSDTIIWDIQNT